MDNLKRMTKGGLMVKTSAGVDLKFESYSKEIRPKLEALRNLIIKTAEETGSIGEIEETLKWGEPSYLVKKGSTIRIDWKEKTPGFYAMYFKCTSKLVPTFKELFGDKFTYENTRAIRFKIDEVVPEEELKICIEMALQYHLIKNEPLLGMQKRIAQKSL